MTRAVIFDLDGTLTDSRPGVLGCFRYAFERLAATGGPKVVLPEDAALDWIIGPPLRDSFVKLAGDEHKEQLWRFYQERYPTVGAFENRVYEGVVDALDRLAQAGAKLFIATSKNERDAGAIVAHFGLAPRFVALYGAHLDGTRVAKHELLGDAIAEHGLKGARIAMIGDRQFDMEGAKAVGVFAIGALWGYGSAEELRKAGADALAATPGEAADLALRL